MNMSEYSARFIKLLQEQDMEMSDKEAMAQSLDKGTDVSEFDVEAPAMAAAAGTISMVQQKMQGQLKEWVAELDRIAEFLNGTGPDSMQTTLNSAEPETLFDKISTAETKKIARVAVEISSLSQMLKGYLATVSDAKYRYS